jgi:N-acetyl-gamma-glutamyl-phosphate reductase
MVDQTSPVRAGILGATGYTGREMVRLLARHPRVEITFATSQSEAGQPLSSLSRSAPDLALVKAEDADLGGVDVVFSCLPHGDSIGWVEKVHAAGAKAIDLSADLRVVSDKTPEWARGAVYGLPELYRAEIRDADIVANPGCYPTAATLAIAPLVRRGLVGGGPVIINAASGVTGAGRSPKRELLFAEVGEDYRAYAVGNVHRHLGEMRDQAEQLSPNGAPELVFTPHLLPVRRGILETIYVPLKAPLTAEAAIALYEDDYGSEPFIHLITDRTPQLTDVVGTNVVAISVVALDRVTSPMLMILVAEDNLLKGASGQALQNLNVMEGWPETLGLE